MLNNINYLIFTLFNIGKLPAAGTFGSIFTIIFYFACYNFFSNLVFVFIIIGVLFYSLFFLQKVLNNFSKDDPKEIVIDEFIGQLIPLVICDGNLLLILLSFISFRFFDILKIYPANIFDKKIKGPIGIIGDDIIAGIYSFIIIYVIKLFLWLIKKLLKN